MKYTLSGSNTLRAIIGAGLLSSLVACGGGSGSQTSTTVTPPSYGGGLTPGSVSMTITNEVTLTTNYGTIVVGLDATHAPLSTANFLNYVTTGFYNASLFHRVVPGFVIQGGGYTDTNGTYTALVTNASIDLESRNGLSNTQYTIAMARLGGEPDSATSQFYFNLVDNSTSLDYPAQDGAGYAVFGTVSSTDTTSIATINAIAAVTTGTNSQTGQADWPVSDVVITSAVQNY